MGHFIDVFDWDWLILNPVQENILRVQISLCTHFFPCSLAIVGYGNGSLIFDENASIACNRNFGCDKLTLSSVQVYCDDKRALLNSALEVDGATMVIENSTFSRCHSIRDGGAINSYNEATVLVNNCSFLDCQSSGTGGAINVLGSSLSLTETKFLNCSSLGGGGAVSVAEYVCYGKQNVAHASVVIESCLFEACSSHGFGGAIFAISASANVSILNSAFDGCWSKKSGGAVAVANSGFAYVRTCIFTANHADGVGGGALYSQSARLTLKGLSCIENAAGNGGGGALYWQGEVPKIVPWCDIGHFSDKNSSCIPSGCENRCTACTAGYFLPYQGAEQEVECIMCPPGKFSQMSGASVCFDCGIGKFSTAMGADSSYSCVDCSAGFYTFDIGQIECWICPPGTYSLMNGSSTCDDCAAGTYSAIQGATAECAPCAQGKFSFYSIDCLECGVGRVSLEKAVECTNCIAGTYSNVSIASACLVCDAGSYSQDESASSCTQCSAGTYTFSEGTSLTDVAGTYVAFVGASSCLLCAAGTYSDQASSSCRLCTAGKYSSKIGAGSELDCLDCEQGLFSQAGYQYCLGIENFRVGNINLSAKVGLNCSTTECADSFALPFNFSLKSGAISYVRMSSIGILVFETFSAQETIFTIPNQQHLTQFTSEFGDDITWMNHREQVLVWMSSDEATFQWSFWSNTISTAAVIFQASLFPNSSVRLSYIVLEGDYSSGSIGELAIVGITRNNENVEYSFPLPSLYSGLCLLFSPDESKGGDYRLETYDCPRNILLAKVCMPGQHLKANLICGNCEPGKYQTGSGMLIEQNCTACESGKYSSASGATSSHVCSACDECDGISYQIESTRHSELGIVISQHQTALKYFNSANLMNSLEAKDVEKEGIMPTYKMGPDAENMIYRPIMTKPSSQRFLR